MLNGVISNAFIPSAVAPSRLSLSGNIFFKFQLSPIENFHILGRILLSIGCHDTQHNDIQYVDTQYNGLNCDTDCDTPFKCIRKDLFPE